MSAAILVAACLLLCTPVLAQLSHTLRSIKPVGESTAEGYRRHDDNGFGIFPRLSADGESMVYVSTTWLSTASVSTDRHQSTVWVESGGQGFRVFSQPEVVGKNPKYFQYISHDGSTIGGTVVTKTDAAGNWTERNAMVWSKQAGLRLLFTDNLATRRPRVKGISRDGSIVAGIVENIDPAQGPSGFRWSAQNGLQEFKTLGGQTFDNLGGRFGGISPDGDTIVFNRVDPSNGNPTANYLYRFSDQNLEKLPDGFDCGIGADGTVFGSQGRNRPWIRIRFGEYAYFDVPDDNSSVSIVSTSADGGFVYGIGGYDLGGCRPSTAPLVWNRAGRVYNLRHYLEALGLLQRVSEYVSVVSDGPNISVNGDGSTILIGSKTVRSQNRCTPEATQSYSDHNWCWVRNLPLIDPMAVTQAADKPGQIRIVFPASKRLYQKSDLATGSWTLAGTNSVTNSGAWSAAQVPISDSSGFFSYGD